MTSQALPKLLVLCTGNSCRSQMMHGFLKKLTEGKGWGVLNFTRESPYKVVTDYAKEKKKQITEKVKNIGGGLNVVIKKLKGKD